MKKIKEWIKRYWLSEFVSYVLALFLGTVIFMKTQNYYISGIFVIIGDIVGYYSVIFFKEIKETIKINKKYTFKLFLIDIRNLGFEFGPPQIVELFLTYPLAMFYIPPYFANYSIGAFIAMTIVVIIFYMQSIVLYEVRKKIFPKK